MGNALLIPHQERASIESEAQVVACQNKLLRVIEVFGELTPFEELTWSKIHRAVALLDEVAAKRIKEDHRNLIEPCKPEFVTSASVKLE